MTTCEPGTRDGGFTLIELVVVLAVLGLLLGTAVPLASAVIQADRRQEARGELAAIVTALESFYFENAAFPANLAAAGFYGEHLQPGVGDDAVSDPFAASQSYVYSVNTSANTATVYSVGDNGVDDGAASEELVAVVRGAVPGSRKTAARLRLIVEVLANHIEAGGSVAGSWATVRTALGLGSTYDYDGFGTALQWTDATYTLTSAGPDRVFGTADDITL
ncbi:MAG: prepilin-type N-terminal cleavage/methylation domain-containing protein [Planctomycetes bacterium]|nr:prepilin-type N-terminal cleavage/methylation domain-containing protein [Planctomycetota bacterium]